MDWKIIEGKLNKTYKAKDFSTIIEQLTLVAQKADELAHHPDFEVTNYNMIRFTLWTHDTQSISQKDYVLAEEIDIIFG